MGKILLEVVVMNKTIKNILLTLCIPVGVFTILTILCSLNGISLFDTSNHFRTFINAFVVTTFISWALNFNLSSGRFDFSLGALGLLASIIGVRITWLLEGVGGPSNGVIMLLIIIAVGAILGAISGILYILLNIAPIVTSLGVTLLYEALTFIVTGGSGIVLNSSLHLTKIASAQNQMIILMIGFILIFVISNFTKFGYEWRALITGQKISVDTGISEKWNALVCYILAGIFISVAITFTMSIQGTASASLNFSTISTIFAAFLPLFLGGFIGRFSEEKLGIMIGSFTTALITLGLVRLDVSPQMQALWNALILLAFLVYLNNEGKLKTILRLR
jgi:ribose transport system permease protein